MELDHLILGISDLAHGTRQFEAMTGISPRFGGRHPDRDTQNALASLGSGLYLEILAPADSKAGSKDPRVPYKDLTFSSWALQVNGIDALIGRLRAAGMRVGDPTPGSRQTRDGALLRWKTAMPSGAGLELAPFFIEWAAGSIHPSESSPAGCRLAGLDLEHPDPGQLRALFAAAGFNANLRPGPAARMTMILDCP